MNVNASSLRNELSLDGSSAELIPLANYERQRTDSFKLSCDAARDAAWSVSGKQLDKQTVISIKKYPRQS